MIRYFILGLCWAICYGRSTVKPDSLPFEDLYDYLEKLDKLKESAIANEGDSFDWNVDNSQYDGAGVYNNNNSNNPVDDLLPVINTGYHDSYNDDYYTSDDGGGLSVGFVFLIIGCVVVKILFWSFCCFTVRRRYYRYYRRSDGTLLIEPAGTTSSGIWSVGRESTTRTIITPSTVPTGAATVTNNPRLVPGGGTGTQTPFKV